MMSTGTDCARRIAVAATGPYPRRDRFALIIPALRTVPSALRCSARGITEAVKATVPSRQLLIFETRVTAAL